MPLIKVKKKKDIWYPHKNYVPTDLNTNSWYNHLNCKSILEYPKIINNTIINNTEIIRCDKIIIYPNSNQKEILLKWFEHYRKMYNCAIKYIRKQIYLNNNDKKIYSFYTLRNLLKNDKQKLLLDKIPSHTLDNAINDVCKAYKTAFSNINKNIKHFRLRYKRKDKNNQTIVIESTAFKGNYSSFCTNVLGKLIKTEEDYDLKNVKKDCRLSYNKYQDKFILFVPVERKVIINDKSEICSIDPGVRTFLSCYSSNETNFISIDNNDKLKKYMLEIDSIKSDENVKNKKKALYKRYEKIKNMVTDMHWKACKFLCQKYRAIYIGNMSTEKCISKKNKTIGKMTKRILCALSLYKFKERLQAKCEEYNVIYKEVDESYTSKTCCKCNTIKNNLGAVKVYKCCNKDCSLIINRDINGAINILNRGHV
jgi:IS605 OrfB family transposase